MKKQQPDELKGILREVSEKDPLCDGDVAPRGSEAPSTAVVRKRMLCPCCLERVRFVHREEDGRNVRFSCPNCNESVPNRYVLEYEKFPPVIFSLIGLPGHGKTVLLHSFPRAFSAVASHWPGFDYQPLDEQGERIFEEIDDGIREGKLPSGTPQVFPSPVIVRLNGVFGTLGCNLLAYDTGGEVFKAKERLLRFGAYVLKADWVVWLVSLEDLNSPRELERLLTVYTEALIQENADPGAQRLLVVLTKGDLLMKRRGVPEEVRKTLKDGAYHGDRDAVRTLRRTSDAIGLWFDRDAELRNFVRRARGDFREVKFSVVSSLGFAPGEKTLSFSPAPRNVLAPVMQLCEELLPKTLVTGRGRPKRYAFLEDAVNDAPPGSTLRLDPGTHRVHAPLRPNKPLVLIGHDEGSVIRTENGRSAVTIDSVSFAARGISFEHIGERPGNGVVVRNSRVEFDSCRFYAQERGESSRHGVGLFVCGESFVKAVECESSENPFHGVVVADRSELDLQGSEFSRNYGHGLVALGHARVHARGSVFGDNQGCGVHATEAAQADLVENSCDGNHRHGIGFRKQSSGRVRGNKLRRNLSWGLFIARTADVQQRFNEGKGNGRGRVRDESDPEESWLGRIVRRALGVKRPSSVPVRSPRNGLNGTTSQFYKHRR